METWKPIPSEPGYEASDLGRVRSVDRVVHHKAGKNSSYSRRCIGKVLSPGRTPSGHLTVACGRGNSRSVHVLVLEAFVGPAPEGHECLHKDDVPDDNRLERLRWGTRSENISDKTRFGKNLLTVQQIREIRLRFVPKCPVNGGAALSRELGVSLHCVYHVTSGGYRAH